ncbi:head GIN domain-containing protein [Formosa maritima]|uniref:DUF2807 domain-containing protein n=1 Tax=Formosa maritima TaxID=2592046 RepID=A0A5D0GKF4_9FLAO|nr:head GIN domain-containing protein [Formosa maritima]TYA58002.1 DUF2807 domain-containing protein [Formosa maritima]
MKKILYILVFAVLFSCDSEDAIDCFQKSGNIIQQEVVVEPFEKILVNRNIELILKEAPEFHVLIETGENLMNDVEVEVVNNQLRLTDNNHCNYVRDYEPTKVYVSAPNITDIRSSTQFDISSDGVLSYNNLKLFSEDSNYTGTITVGDFRLQVNTNILRITANNISSFYISGQTNNLIVGFYSGVGRFEGANLEAQEVEIYHRGSNDMIVNPQLSLTGELRGTGDLISKNNPPIVEVEQFYTGELIFD